ncbi:Polysaccharide deacetylase [Butyrivibrio fibrisolvens DSM 3071]|uniref:Polysaccharide deacetylase n=1 Tax=Butyrivibrio fibrisolvens DSM 3071 TaxID=1121131 RepID=A0A1M5YYC0_BUTFI|nr:polysaccharide deacetylase family protein [Butyrivibrio fibrisolvens]SHI16975.1 Polysaccharide deacetylase [Butyrivibrio fibrisolvens DSM 3071]
MNKVVILYYHRINEQKTDYNLTNVSPGNFEAQLKMLLEKYDLISIYDIYDGSAFKRDRNAVAITFDDGYKDVFNNAVPLLESMEINYTCLITTQNIWGGDENWTDVVTRVAFEPEVFHEECKLIIDGEQKVFMTDCLENRVAFYRALQQIYKTSSCEEWNEISIKIREWAGIRNSVRSSYRIMDIDDIKRIKERGGIIGAHTVSHPYLSCLNEREIEYEVSESKKTLEKITGEKVDIFSYPFGDAPKKVRSVLDTCGYKIAMTSNKGVVTKNSDVMYLPRIGVKDWSIHDFGNVLEDAFR